MQASPLSSPNPRLKLQKHHWSSLPGLGARHPCKLFPITQAQNCRALKSATLLALPPLPRQAAASTLLLIIMRRACGINPAGNADSLREQIQEDMTRGSDYTLHQAAHEGGFMRECWLDRVHAMSGGIADVRGAEATSPSAKRSSSSVEMFGMNFDWTFYILLRAQLPTVHQLVSPHRRTPAHPQRDPHTGQVAEPARYDTS
eukprot:1149018-Pelagomonas_calceolata.AAC.2